MASKPHVQNEREFHVGQCCRILLQVEFTVREAIILGKCLQLWRSSKPIGKQAKF